jgi:hypothetical protein
MGTGSQTAQPLSGDSSLGTCCRTNTMHDAAMTTFQQRRSIIGSILVTLFLVAAGGLTVPLAHAWMLANAFAYDDQVGVHLLHNHGAEMNAYIDRLQDGSVVPLHDDNGIRTFPIPACAADCGMSHVVEPRHGIICCEFYFGFDGPILNLVYSAADFHPWLKSQNTHIVPGSIDIIDDHWVYYKTP